MPLKIQEQQHGALSFLKQTGMPSPDGPQVRAVKFGIKVIANSPSAAKVAPLELARSAGPDILILLSGQYIWPNLRLH